MADSGEGHRSVYIPPCQASARGVSVSVARPPWYYSGLSVGELSSPGPSRDSSSKQLMHGDSQQAGSQEQIVHSLPLGLRQVLVGSSPCLQLRSAPAACMERIMSYISSLIDDTPPGWTQVSFGGTPDSIVLARPWLKLERSGTARPVADPPASVADTSARPVADPPAPREDHQIFVPLCMPYSASKVKAAAAAAAAAKRSNPKVHSQLCSIQAFCGSTPKSKTKTKTKTRTLGGYLKLKLCSSSQHGPAMEYAHRLVLWAFQGPPPPPDADAASPKGSSLKKEALFCPPPMATPGTPHHVNPSAASGTAGLNPLVLPATRGRAAGKQGTDNKRKRSTEACLNKSSSSRSGSNFSDASRFSGLGGTSSCSLGGGFTTPTPTTTTSTSPYTCRTRQGLSDFCRSQPMAAQGKAGWVCMHTCGNPMCLQPWHLKWGKQAENCQQGADQTQDFQGTLSPNQQKAALNN